VAVALSWRQIGTRTYGSRCCERQSRFFLAASAHERDWLFDWLGEALGVIRGRKFHSFRVHRNSLGDSSTFHHLCASMDQMEYIRRTVASNFDVYGMAGRIVVSRLATESSFKIVQERIGGVVDRLNAIRIFTHNEYGISQLAVRPSGNAGRHVLRLDVA
jgi:hypothetical protein